MPLVAVVPGTTGYTLAYPRGTVNRDPAEIAKIGDALVSIYKSDKDSGVRKAITQTLYVNQDAKSLVAIARSETDPTMKRDLVQKLSTMKSKEATDYMLELLK